MADRVCTASSGSARLRSPRGLAHTLSNRTRVGVSPRIKLSSRKTVRAQAVVESLHSVDPTHLHDHLTQVLYQLSDADVAAAVAEPEKKAGFFNFFAQVLETFLKIIDGGLEAVHVPYSYGFSIILLTILVKIGTFPLSKKQLESNLQIQALQPRIEKLKEMYADDQERLQLETAKLYKVAEVNPLAGCLPTFVSLPIYIGLYRSLTNAADEGLLGEGFFWIPSLAGPTTIAARQAGTGSAWLFPFENGAPPIGWHDAGAYLVLPVLLIVSQYASQKILSGNQQQTEQQQSANAIIKFLPLMIGWFSLNVPSGLTLYWFTNNLLSVSQTAFLRANFKAPEINDDMSTSGAAPVERVSVADLQPKPVQKDKRSGDKFWALKQAESGGGSAGDNTVVAAEFKNAEPERGAKFRQLKSQEAQATVEATSNAVVSTEVAEAAPPPPPPPAAAEEEKEEGATTAAAAASNGGFAPAGETKKKPSALNKKKGKGGNFKKKKR